MLTDSQRGDIQRLRSNTKLTPTEEATLRVAKYFANPTPDEAREIDAILDAASKK